VAKAQKFHLWAANVILVLSLMLGNVISLISHSD